MQPVSLLPSGNVTGHISTYHFLNLQTSVEQMLHSTSNVRTAIICVANAFVLKVHYEI